MNRILTVAETRRDGSSPHEDLTVSLSDDSGCGLFAPINYEPNYAYPLIVWLHDSGGDECQLPQLMPYVSLRNFVAAAPRGVLPQICDGLREGWTWGERPADVQAAREAVETCIATALQEYRVHPGRIFLVGHGVGGTLALRLSLLAPDRFAGAASLLGAFPRGDQPLRHLAAVRQLPLLLSIGSDSQRYPTAEFCDDLRLFHAAAMQVQVRQYPVEDDLTTIMLDDLNRWVMQQVCPPAVVEQSRRSTHRANCN